jgi:OOP family OmpA-OmpF porin
MKRFLGSLFIVSILASSAYADSRDKRAHHDTYHHDQSETQIDGTLHDLAFPWPFGKPQGADSDGDGVTDSSDRCPGTPRNARVDRFGCPELAEARAALLDSGTLTAHDIIFDSEKATVRRGSYATLHEVGRTMESSPDLKVEVAGHTDSKGAALFNQQLSERRAQAVRSYLLNNFKIEPGRLVAVGHGEKQPVASNNTEKGREQNRRVEFNVLNADGAKRTRTR